jgi:hypothetical protein
VVGAVVGATFELGKGINAGNLRVLTYWQTEPLANAVGLRKKKKLL